MRQLGGYIAAIENVIDVDQSSYAELESKWRRFNSSFQEIVSVALPEHVRFPRVPSETQ
jgi:hypothetical protein